MSAHPLQSTALAIVVGSPVLAAVFVCIRIYARWKVNLKLRLDDWSVIVAVIFSLGFIWPSWRHILIWHVGWHIWEITYVDLQPDYHQYYGILLSFQLLNIPVVPLVKVSLIYLLMRASAVIGGLKKILYGVLVFTVGTALIPWCLYIFICPPKADNTWAPRTFGNLHCLGRRTMGEMIIWTTCANLITDVLILPIPFVIARRMVSASVGSRATMIAVFLCGLCVTAIGAVKIQMSFSDRLTGRVKQDWTFNIAICLNHVENNVAIILANIPVFRGLLSRARSGREAQLPRRSVGRYENSQTSSNYRKRLDLLAQKVFPRLQIRSQITMNTQVSPGPRIFLQRPPPVAQTWALQSIPMDYHDFITSATAREKDEAPRPIVAWSEESDEALSLGGTVIRESHA